MLRGAKRIWIVLISTGILGAVVLLRREEPTTAQPAKDPTPATPAVESGFAVKPYLQFPTRNSITIMWETAQAGTSVVEYGSSSTAMTGKASGAENATLHEVALENLKPNCKYVYRASSTNPDGKTIASELLTFMTAVDEDSAFSFAVIGDTQKNPKMTGQIGKLIWDRRPNFLIHVGDVVDNGPDKLEWTDELFGPCSQLLSRVALFPAIGNHEKNHPHYYKYFSMPAPKYYYRYNYGNADFFVIDTNKSVKPGTEQFQWLDDELGKSTAKWKFVYHHHPAYSSDDDDYGNTWKGPGREGDLNARNLVQLYEKHNVDICFNGHIHLYERSWPLRAGKVAKEKGVVYITSGGGGGKLENFAPTPTWFKKQCRVDFHFCLVNIQGGNLEFKVFDQKGGLFDTFELSK